MKEFGGMSEVKTPDGKRADYINSNEVYEIKPITQHMSSSVQEQLDNYFNSFNLEDIPMVKGENLLLEFNGQTIDTSFSVLGVNVKTQLRLIIFQDFGHKGMVYYDQKTDVNTKKLQEALKPVLNIGLLALSVIMVLKTGNWQYHLI